MLDLETYDVEFRDGLRVRLSEDLFAGKSVLCLAARIGTEVKAFHDLGAFAVGIDLQPGPKSETVLTGDFHAAVFPDQCVDVIYCNSLDHAFDLTKTLAETRRLLKPAGLLLLDVQDGTSDGDFDDWAATSWANVSDVVEAVEDAGFKIDKRQRITVPWNGDELRAHPA